MRRPSRLFTVEVKRSRSRGGEASVADTKVKRGQKFSASVSGQPASGQLSWGDLLTRAAEEIGAAAEPSGAETAILDDRHTILVAEKAVSAAVDRSPAAAEAPAPSGAPRSRVLPSLLPPETPAPEPAAVLSDDASDAADDVGSPLASARPAKQRARKVAPSVARAPRIAAGNVPVSAAPVSDTTDFPSKAPAAETPPVISSLDSEHIRAIVEQHLRHRPASRDVPSAIVDDHFEVEQEAAGSRPHVKRRRQDFWKRRLRSRAAHD